MQKYIDSIIGNEIILIIVIEIHNENNFIKSQPRLRETLELGHFHLHSVHWTWCSWLNHPVLGYSFNNITKFINDSLQQSYSFRVSASSS